MRSFRMGYGLGGILQRLLNVSGNFGAQNTLQGGNPVDSRNSMGASNAPVNPFSSVLQGLPAAMPVNAPEQLGGEKNRRAFNYGYGQDHDFGRRNLDALTYTQGTTTPTLEQLLGRDSMMGDQFTIQDLINQAEMDRQSRFNNNSMMYTPTPFTFTPPTPPPAPAPAPTPMTMPMPTPSMDRRDAGTHRQGGVNDDTPAQRGNTRDSGGAGAGGGAEGSSGCFVKGTMIQMADGTEKEITSINVGEETKGGTVEAKTEFMPHRVYDYKGIKVSGSHLVMEDNEMVTIENSKHGVLLKTVSMVFLQT